MTLRACVHLLSAWASRGGDAGSVQDFELVKLGEGLFRRRVRVGKGAGIPPDLVEIFPNKNPPAWSVALALGRGRQGCSPSLLFGACVGFGLRATAHFRRSRSESCEVEGGGVWVLGERQEG